MKEKEGKGNKGQWRRQGESEFSPPNPPDKT